MTTVYLATSGEYSDYRVQHVFARREDAESYALGEDVEERELQEGPVEVRDWHQLNWRPGHPDREGTDAHVSNPWHFTSQRDYDGRAAHVQHRWLTHAQFQPATEVLIVEGWDLERVRKVYSEQRTMHIAVS
jgi:hypothetical protein